MTGRKAISGIKVLQLKATTMDLCNWLIGKMVLYLNDLTNPKNGLNLISDPL
jgi:hypothetical protein